MGRNQVKSRNQKGAMLGFITAGMFAIIFFAFAIMQLLFNIGGSRELRNAVDAGTLTVGRKSITIKTTAQDPIEQQFNDVADPDNSFGLTNINRVWAKALLARMNAAAMETDNTSSGSSGNDADALYDAAQRISDRIANQLKDQNKLHGFFDDVSGRNSVRMLGMNTTTQTMAGDNWKTSLMDRGQESNIIVYAGQLPGNFTPENSQTIQASDGQIHFKGYTAINVMGRNVCFVPFKVNEKPHLVSSTTFTNNTMQTAAFTSWVNPVPNAFSCAGQTQGQQAGPSQQAVSYVLSNPEQNFDLTFRHGFIRIKFEDNTAKWYVNGIPHGSNSYDFHTDVQVRQYEAGVGTMTATATLGNEYMPPTLNKAIQALPTHNYSDVMNALVQRVREMKHDFDKNDLEALLSSQPFLPGSQEYVIYCNDEGQIKVAPKAVAEATVSWIKDNFSADGNEKDLNSESIWWAPNVVVVVLEGPGPKPAPSFTHETGDIHWRPGTGFNGCLGQLRIERTTEIYCNGVCTVL